MDTEEQETNNSKLGLSREEIAAKVNALQRSVFADVLVDILECGPTKDALQYFANRYPDRYFSSVAVMAQLSGYQRDINITTNVHIVEHLPDSSLRQRLATAERALSQLSYSGNISDVKPIEANGETISQVSSRETIAVEQHETQRTIDDDDRTIDMPLR